MGQTLSDVIGRLPDPAGGDPGAGFLLSRSRMGFARSTLRSEEGTMRKLLASLGNLYVRSIAPRHVDQFFAGLVDAGLAPATLNLHLSNVRIFCGWCRTRRKESGVPLDWDPCVGRRKYPDMPEDKLFVPVTDFPRLLDATTHPRDRIAVALGLYLFIRASEVTGLQIGQVDLPSGRIDVRVWKSSKRDRMSIPLELDQELRQYLTWYAQTHGPLEADWWLVPAKAKPRIGYDRELKRARAYLDDLPRMRPTVRAREIERAAQRPLSACGYPIKKQGIHTLRRSGARALYERLKNQGHDAAVRLVSARLHHSTISTTEIYLDVNADKKELDGMLLGQPMFPVNRSNVVPLITPASAAQ